MTMEASKSKICSVSQQAGDSGELMVQMKVQRQLLRISSCLERPVFLFNSGLQLIG